MTDKQSKQSTGSMRLFYQRFLSPLKGFFLVAIILQMIFVVWDVAFFSLNGYMVDHVIPQGRKADFLTISILYLVAILVISLLFVSLNFMARGRISQGLMFRIREEGFGHLQKLSFSYFDRNTLGNLLARMTTDAKTYSIAAAWQLPGALYLSLFVLGLIGYMLYLNWKISLIVFTTIPLTLILIVAFQKRILAVSRKVMGMNSKLTTAYNEGITGVKTIRSLAEETAFIEKFEKLSAEMFSYSRKRVLETALFIPLIIATTGVGLGLLLWFGTEEVLAGGMSLGVLIILGVYARFFAEFLLFLMRTIGEIQPAIASQDRIFNVLNTPAEIRDSDAVIQRMAMYQGNVHGAGEDGYEDRIESIEFREVDFSYKADEPVLQGFNLKVKQGESIALVGDTGAGKSTIVSLLCRFYEPTSGEICFNNRDYRERSLHWLQSSLGIVLQTPFLFGGTIRDNIRFGNPDASNNQVIKAAEIVNAHPFITNLEQGYDTPVGEDGNRLSSGQKQLISFARAILVDPQILILDEATSSVDPETEHLIQKGLHQVLKGRFSFIVAHRLSTIREANRILLIKKGRIIEQGSHDELIALNGVYLSLYQKQFLYHQEREILGRDRLRNDV
jgi:ATP-binding cassette, subfamily B, bacterial